MGEDCGPWFPLQQFDWQSPNLDYLGAASHLGQRSTIPAFMNLGTERVSLNGTLPVNPYPELPQTLPCQTNEPHGWFYGLHRFRQAFMPSSNNVPKEQFPTAHYENCKEAIPKPESGGAQKRFLVFDQSGDQTTLIYSPGIGAPVQCFTSWTPKPTVAYNLNKEDRGPKENLNLNLGTKPIDLFGVSNGADLQSEMHEDTEELNALLYSDDESNYTEDDEVTSTGHSPSTMTAHDKQDWLEGITEDVASSDGSNKKRKLFNGGYSDAPSVLDTASSIKHMRCSEYEDDAESRCENGTYSSSGKLGPELGPELGIKWMRKERIRETVSILQDIIPGGKGKDAIMVIDEAIHYLKSLKLKAKALGLDAL